MLFLAVFPKTYRVLKREKRVVLSFTIMTLIVLSGFLGVFMGFKDTSVSAWTPSTYTYYEDFENTSAESSGYDADVLGAYSETNPNATWYNTTGDQIGSLVLYPDDSVNITNMTVNWTGNQSLLVFDYNESYEGICFNFTNSTGAMASHQIDYVNFSFRPRSNGTTFHFWLSNGTGSSDRNVHIYLREDNNTIQVKMNDTAVDYLGSPPQEWGLDIGYNISFHNFNYTEFSYNISLQVWGGAMTDYGKYYFRFNATSLASLGFTGTTTGDTTNMSIDNIEVGSPTEMYTTVGGGSYPSIDATAFNSSLTLVSGNYSITYNSTVNDTILWCNASGSANETMNVTIIDGNESVTFINISLVNVSDGGSNYINADDFFLYVYNDSSTNWINKSNFPTDGGNITLDSSDTDIGVTWPITGDDTILCRFKLVVSDSQVMTLYVSAGCGVYIGG